ncbi:MAG: ribosomal protein S18-alanine N-acetyltransferase [Thermoplasmata archaeon]|nr:ribosomal protein S18-alanine N-acetyltransferase [Thermoplasmata archaeon]
MEIRKVRFEDMQHVYELAKKYLKESYTFDLILNLWNFSPNGFLVAVEKGAVVGFIIGVKTSVDSLRILMLAVDEQHRKRGIGSALLKKLQLNFPEVRRMYLETRVDNEEAIKFYKKHGFRIVDREKDFYTDGSEAYIMEKILF